MKKLGPEGLTKLLSAYENKRAKAVCIFAYSNGENEKVHLFKGETTGIIVSPRELIKGNSFGWDPIFQPDYFKQTYAELDVDVKNKISHRSKSIEKLKLFLSLMEEK